MRDDPDRWYRDSLAKRRRDEWRAAVVGHWIGRGLRLRFFALLALALLKYLMS